MNFFRSRILMTMFFAVLSVAILISINPLFPKYSLAQQNPFCYQATPSGEVIDLSSLCSREREDIELSGSTPNSEEIQQLSVIALNHMERGEFQQAHDNLTQVISLMNSDHPDLPAIYYERGTTSVGKSDLQSARSDFETAARIYSERGDQEGIEQMQESLALLSRIQR